MSKYIRTKDGRIVDTTTYINHIGAYAVQARDYGLTIAQSDNLEELFDVLVIEDKNIYNDGVSKYLMHPPFVLYDEGVYSTIISVRGAIWTDKGLIYVAKRNKEGKFELI